MAVFTSAFHDGHDRKLSNGRGSGAPARPLEPLVGCTPQGNRLDYHTNGTRRCRTRFWYSVYPGRFPARNRSSSKSRQSRKGIIAATGTSPQYEPSASGVPSRYRDALAYIGWRTMAYGPVTITVCFSATSMVAEVHVFS